MTGLDDIRALGTGAALRAAYEASKRTGGHAVVFGSLKRRNSTATGTSPFAFADIPPRDAESTLAVADEVLGGTVQLFGRPIELGADPDWHATIDGDGSWPTIDWWKIDIRSDSRMADVKWTWELGRHRHLVLLARAAFLEPNNPSYAAELNRQLGSWMVANPPETGVHWYSNLEIALRSIAWLQILGLAETSLNPDVNAAMWSHIGHAGRHLLADLPYTVSTMRNNHLLGDALGLVAIGTALGRRRWVQVGDRIFNSQLRRHMRSDGSMVEDSTSYHRFVLEMLILRELVGGAAPSVRDAMLDAAQFLCRLGVLDGPIPQYGDWDEGRALVSCGDPGDLSGSVLTALGLAGTGATAEQREEHDEAAWYTWTGIPVDPDPAEVIGGDLGAAIARSESSGSVVWLKMGSGPSHGHADLSSLTLVRDGTVVMGDPGTGTYNGELRIRNHFRGSASHNVLRVGGAEQLEAHRAFRWLTSANGVVGPPLRLGSTMVSWGAHDAYSTDESPFRVVRVVALGSNGDLAVRDHVERSNSDSLLSLQFPPGIALSPGDTENVFRIASGQLVLAVRGATAARLSEGGTEPFEGWWSATYGSWVPAPCVTAQLDDSAEGGFDLLSQGAEPIELQSSVEWLEGKVRLSVSIGDEASMGELRLD